MSYDEVAMLPDDVRDALRDARAAGGLEDPGPAVRARMRARLRAALPSAPGGGGESGAAPAAGLGAGGASLLLRQAPVWAVAAAFLAGGAAGLAYPRSPAVSERAERTPTTTAGSAAESPLAAAARGAPTAAPPTIDPKDLPSARDAPPTPSIAAAARGGDLAAEQGILDVARTALGRSDGPSALDACDAHARRFPRGSLAEEREAIAVQALVLEGRADEARARATLFRQSHPKSILLPAVLAAAGIAP